MNKVKVWVYKDDENILRPLAFITMREGMMGDYAQPDIDKFMKKMKGEGSVVEAEIIEVVK